MGFNNEDRKNLDIIARAIDPDKDQSSAGPPFTLLGAFGGFGIVPLGFSAIFYALGIPTDLFLIAGLTLRELFLIVGASVLLGCFLLDKLFGLGKR